jgi:hypothetical protein
MSYAIVRQRLNYDFVTLAHYFMEPHDYHDTPIRNVLLFIRNVGLTERLTRRGSTIDL